MVKPIFFRCSNTFVQSCFFGFEVISNDGFFGGFILGYY